MMTTQRLAIPPRANQARQHACTVTTMRCHYKKAKTMDSPAWNNCFLFGCGAVFARRALRTGLPIRRTGVVVPTLRSKCPNGSTGTILLYLVYLQRSRVVVARIQLALFAPAIRRIMPVAMSRAPHNDYDAFDRTFRRWCMSRFI